MWAWKVRFTIFSSNFHQCDHFHKMVHFFKFALFLTKLVLLVCDLFFSHGSSYCLNNFLFIFMKILRKRGEMNNIEGAKFTHLADFSPHICSLPIFFVLLTLFYDVKWPSWHFVLISAFWATDFVMFTWFCFKNTEKVEIYIKEGQKYPFDSIWPSLCICSWFI